MTYVDQHRQRRPVLALPNAASRRPLKPHKAPRWNHQNELDALAGQTIVLVYPDGSSISGTLLGADPYGIRIGVDARAVTTFKHDLRAYGRVVSG